MKHQCHGNIYKKTKEGTKLSRENLGNTLKLLEGSTHLHYYKRQEICHL